MSLHYKAIVNLTLRKIELVIVDRKLFFDNHLQKWAYSGIIVLLMGKIVRLRKKYMI